MLKKTSLLMYVVTLTFGVSSVIVSEISLASPIKEGHALGSYFMSNNLAVNTVDRKKAMYKTMYKNKHNKHKIMAKKNIKHSSMHKVKASQPIVESHPLSTEGGCPGQCSKSL